MWRVPSSAEPCFRFQRPIFVVGTPRSGTTLVQCILSAGSATYSLPETQFFTMVLPSLRLAPHEPLTAEALDRYHALVEADPDLIPLATDRPRAVLEQRVAEGRASALDLLGALLEQGRPPHDAPHRRLRVVEKTPLHVLHLDQIGDSFPDARVVHVLRDPTDVVSSWLGAPFAHSRSVTEYARAWVETVQAARTYSQRDPTRLLAIRHEDLVRDPEGTVRAMCAFLDLDYEPRMLLEFGEQAPRNTHGNETWKQDVRRGVLLDRHGVWRGRITPGQAWLVARATRESAARAGYTAAFRASPASILAAVGRELRVRFSEARASDGPLGAARHAASALKVRSHVAATG